MIKIKLKNGITLIALVITIIIMLILVAVTISLAVRGGLFGYARNATLETENAKNEEQKIGLGIIGDKTINDFVYGKESIIRFVDYNNTRFLIAGEQNNRIKLIPLTFPDENVYLVSGKYKIVNGKKKSVALNDSAAMADSDFEEFGQRIKDELDYACKEKYETNNDKVTAYNTPDYTTTIMDFYSLLYNAFDESEIDDIEKLLTEDIEVFKDLNNGLEQPDWLSQYGVNNNSLSFFLIWTSAISSSHLTTIINNQINNYNLDSITIDTNSIMGDSMRLLKKEITVDDLDSSDMIKKYCTELFYRITEFEIYLQESINCTGSNTHGGNDWQIEKFSWWDGYSVSDFLRRLSTDESQEDQFGTINTHIAPIVLVDEDLLQRTGRNTYKISVN